MLYICVGCCNQLPKLLELVGARCFDICWGEGKVSTSLELNRERKKKKEKKKE